ncbi:MAG: glycerophosphodiester phosphodiesterase [Salibacteraceae bacterium]
MKVIAHRGASGLAPENTISAFEIAVKLGADMIEIDVRPTKDQKAIVFHDQHLDRITNTSGAVDQRYLAELKKMDAGSWFNDNKHVNETIPTLDETIDYLKDKCEILVEIKNEQNDISDAFLNNLSQLIDKHDVRESVILQSFDSRTLKKFYSLHPGYRLQKLIVWKIPFVKIQLDQRLMLEDILKNPRYQSINVDHRFVTPNFVRKIHRHNKKIYCWTVNEQLRMFRLMNMGVDGIITNYPNKLKQLLKEQG